MTPNFYGRFSKKIPLAAIVRTPAPVRNFPLAAIASLMPAPHPAQQLQPPSPKKSLSAEIFGVPFSLLVDYSEIPVFFCVYIKNQKLANKNHSYFLSNHLPPPKKRGDKLLDLRSTSFLSGPQSRPLHKFMPSLVVVSTTTLLWQCFILASLSPQLKHPMNTFYCM